MALTSGGGYPNQSLREESLFDLKFPRNEPSKPFGLNAKERCRWGERVNFDVNIRKPWQFGDCHHHAGERYDSQSS
jgi:hypothetical protein